MLVNLDLPLDASRLDQRIGRLDRYAVRPEPAEVVVFTEPASAWVTAQIRLLHEGTGVFDASVSTVQRMLADVLQKVLGGLLPHGVDALAIDVEDLRERLETEREDIDLLEEMESVSAASVFGHDAFAELVEYEDGDDEALRLAVQATDAGHRVARDEASGVQDGVVRFGGAKEIGLPEDEVPSSAAPAASAEDVLAQGGRRTGMPSHPSGSATRWSTGWTSTCASTSAVAPTPSSVRSPG